MWRRLLRTSSRYVIISHILAGSGFLHFVGFSCFLKLVGVRNRHYNSASLTYNLYINMYIYGYIPTRINFPVKYLAYCQVFSYNSSFSALISSLNKRALHCKQGGSYRVHFCDVMYTSALGWYLIDWYRVTTNNSTPCVSCVASVGCCFASCLLNSCLCSLLTFSGFSLGVVGFVLFGGVWGFVVFGGICCIWWVLSCEGFRLVSFD